MLGASRGEPRAEVSLRMAGEYLQGWWNAGGGSAAAALGASRLCVVVMLRLVMSGLGCRGCAWHPGVLHAKDPLPLPPRGYRQPACGHCEPGAGICSPGFEVCLVPRAGDAVPTLVPWLVLSHPLPYPRRRLCKGFKCVDAEEKCNSSRHGSAGKHIPQRRSLSPWKSTWMIGEMLQAARAPSPSGERLPASIPRQNACP